MHGFKHLDLTSAMEPKRMVSATSAAGGCAEASFVGAVGAVSGALAASANDISIK